jgi:hypothetical protein
MENIDPQKMAGVLTDVTRQIAGIQSRLEAGLQGATTPDAIRVSKDAATQGAAAVDALRAALTEWFSFYNGYDPLFTWWNGLPFKKVDAALRAYSTFLRDRLAPVAGSGPGVAPGGRTVIAAAATPKSASVPDLKELMALPQGEMTDIVRRFRGPATGGAAGSGRPPDQTAAPAQGTDRPVSGAGGQPPTAANQPAAQAGQAGVAHPPSVVRDRTFYEGWLRALKSLDFDRLSRNAQVDYLHIKKMCGLHRACRLPAAAQRDHRTDRGASLLHVVHSQRRWRPVVAAGDRVPRRSARGVGRLAGIRRAGTEADEVGRRRDGRTAAVRVGGEPRHAARSGGPRVREPGRDRIQPPGPAHPGT